MRKLAFLLAMTVLLSACAKPGQETKIHQKVVAGGSASAPSEASDASIAEDETAASEPAESEAEPDSSASEAAAQAAAQAAAEAAASEAAAQAAAEAKAKQTSVTGSNFLSNVESEVLKLQNDERARLGLQTLEFDAELQAAARIRSRELCKSGVWAHTRPDGRQWYTVLTEEVPYEYKSAGENLGNVDFEDPSYTQYKDAAFWVNNWIDSPTHYTNMIRDEYNRAGVGIYVYPHDGVTSVIATTIFAWVE